MTTNRGLRARLSIAGGLLLLDGLSAAVGVAMVLPTLATHATGVILMVVLRAMAGALEVTSGWQLFDVRPAAASIGRVGALLAAVHATLGIGLRLAPVNLDPSLRTPAVAAYWLFALVVFALLHHAQSHPGAP